MYLCMLSHFTYSHTTVRVIQEELITFSKMILVNKFGSHCWLKVFQTLE